MPKTKYKYEYEIIDYPSKGRTTGNYGGNAPGQAAKKITRRLASDMNFSNSRNKKLLVFNFRNKITKKEYKYVGTRVKLYKPISINVGDKVIKYKYKTIVTKYNDYYANNQKGGDPCKYILESGQPGLLNHPHPHTQHKKHLDYLLKGIQYDKKYDNSAIQVQRTRVYEYPQK